MAKLTFLGFAAFCQRRLQLRYLHKQLSKSRVPTPFTIPTGIWELDLLHLSDEK
jgi:hypothetical protein